MKRETMEWLRDSREWARRTGKKNEAQRFAEVEAALARLRRIERAARKALRMNTCEGVDLALGELADALKKGGRK